MKICFLSSAHPALDKRVFDKEALTLHRAGYDVLHLCPQSGDEPLGRWTKDGITLETYPRRSSIRGRIRQLHQLYQRAKSIQADAYHCNEVDSWVVGVLLRIVTGSKCVFDVHEHYPSTFAESRFPRWLQPLVASSIKLGYLLLTPATNLFVFAKRSVAPDFWFSKRKHVLVQNFTPKEALATNDGELHLPKEAVGAPVLIHLGLIGRARGWPQLLDAMCLMERQDVCLHIVGQFNDDSEREFLECTKALRLTERIKYDPWMPFHEAFQCLLNADIGLILFQPGIQNHVFALPHKMFDYMLAKLPVIAPDFAEEVRDIVNESRAGLLVDPTRPDDIAAAVDIILADKELRESLGARGRKAVLETYNWENEAVKLVDAYERLFEAVR